MIDLAKWDLPHRANEWRAARPFAHLVIDDLVDAPSLAALCTAVAAEPHWPNRGEIFDLMGSADQVQHPTLRAFHAELGAPEILSAVRMLSGRPIDRVDLRSYVYMPGNYLLPHTDCRTSMGRQVAYAYYLYSREVEGGELELFDCSMQGDDIVATRPALRIEPRENRMVIFEVTPASLHQVREVVRGARVSLSGWFLG
jgi:Rps23 Pro-64 3,4-dihydroxylase Tpa1-like proline 4-hydroxylase